MRKLKKMKAFKAILSVINILAIIAIPVIYCGFDYNILAQLRSIVDNNIGYVAIIALFALLTILNVVYIGGCFSSTPTKEFDTGLEEGPIQEFDEAFASAQREFELGGGSPANDT